MLGETVIELARWQFATAAMLHFLFIPLSLGLALLLALMESAFAITGLEIYQTAARFWSRIFAISFLMAFATRLLVLFQFGMNGSYFSHYVGDVLALPLTLEALTSFFPAAVLFAPYWMGWDTLSRGQHLAVTWLMVLAVNISAYWIMVANGWMQNPLAASFNYQSYRMELTDLAQLLTNPAAVTKYIHTLAAAYLTALASVVGISAFRLRRCAEDAMARVSFKWASMLGVLAIVFTIWPGEDTMSLDNPVQQAKRAALEQSAGEHLLRNNEQRVRNGVQAYVLLQQLRDEDKSPELLAEFEQLKADLGYALLLMPVHKPIVGANEKQIRLAAQSALPAYPGFLRWSYRLMITFAAITGVWLLLAAVFSAGSREMPSWLLGASSVLAVAPWLACLCGWLVAEIGKQPWAVAGVLPTFLSVSSLSGKELLLSSAAYLIVYFTLLLAAGYCLRQAIFGRALGRGEV